MALQFKPHSVTLLAHLPQMDGTRVIGHTWTAARSFDGLFLPKTTTSETDSVSTDPVRRAVFLCDVADAVGIGRGDRIALDGGVWRVAYDPAVFDAGLAADHARIDLRKVPE